MAQSASVRVLGVRVASRAMDGNSQPGLLFTVDLQVPGFTLLAAHVYREANGNLLLTPPRSERHDRVPSGIRFSDAALRDTMLTASCEVARALGVNVDAIEQGAD